MKALFELRLITMNALFLAFMLSPILVEAQGAASQDYTPCPPDLNFAASCYNGARSCSTYEQYLCSPGYCWSGGGIPNNAGIPFNGAVVDKTIDIAGVYTITQNVKF